MDSKLKELGYDKNAVERIGDIINLINKLPISNNKERDDLFNYMISENFTDKEEEKWTEERWIEEAEGPEYKE